MLNRRLNAAKMVAQNLNAFEDAIDEALICAGELTSATARARKTANLSAIVAQGAIAKTGSAIAALYEARAQIVAAHCEFATARDEMGITPRMTGDLWKFKEEGKIEEPTPIHRVA